MQVYELRKNKTTLPASLLEPQLLDQILQALSEELSRRKMSDMKLPGGFMGAYLQARRETYPSLYILPVPHPGTGFLQHCNKDK